MQGRTLSLRIILYFSIFMFAAQPVVFCEESFFKASHLGLSFGSLPSGWRVSADQAISRQVAKRKLVLGSGRTRTIEVERRWLFVDSIPAENGARFDLAMQIAVEPTNKEMATNQAGLDSPTLQTVQHWHYLESPTGEVRGDFKDRFQEFDLESKGFLDVQGREDLVGYYYHLSFKQGSELDSGILDKLGKVTDYYRIIVKMPDSSSPYVSRDTQDLNWYIYLSVYANERRSTQVIDQISKVVEKVRWLVSNEVERDTSRLELVERSFVDDRLNLFPGHYDAKHTESKTAMELGKETMQPVVLLLDPDRIYKKHFQSQVLASLTQDQGILFVIADGLGHTLPGGECSIYRGQECQTHQDNVATLRQEPIYVGTNARALVQPSILVRSPLGHLLALLEYPLYRARDAEDYLDGNYHTALINQKISQAFVDLMKGTEIWNRMRHHQEKQKSHNRLSELFPNDRDTEYKKLLKNGEVLGNRFALMQGFAAGVEHAFGGLEPDDKPDRRRLKAVDRLFSSLPGSVTTNRERAEAVILAFVDTLRQFRQYSDYTYKYLLRFLSMKFSVEVRRQVGRALVESFTFRPNPPKKVFQAIYKHLPKEDPVIEKTDLAEKNAVAAPKKRLLTALGELSDGKNKKARELLKNQIDLSAEQQHTVNISLFATLGLRRFVEHDASLADFLITVVEEAKDTNLAQAAALVLMANFEYLEGRVDEVVETIKERPDSNEGRAGYFTVAVKHLVACAEAEGVELEDAMREAKSEYFSELNHYLVTF